MINCRFLKSEIDEQRRLVKKGDSKLHPVFVVLLFWCFSVESQDLLELEKISAYRSSYHRSFLMLLICEIFSFLKLVDFNYYIQTYVNIGNRFDMCDDNRRALCAVPFVGFNKGHQVQAAIRGTTPGVGD